MTTEAISGVLLLSLGIFTLGLVLALRKQREFKSPMLLVEDPELLALAEREVRLNGYRQSELAVVAIFRSDEGFRDTELLHFVIFLGSEGVDASYHTSYVGFSEGGLQIYRLLAPPTQLDKAQTLLQGYKQSLLLRG